MAIKAGTSLAALQKGKAVQKISNEAAIELLGLDSLYIQLPTSSDVGKYAKAKTGGGVEWSELPAMLELAGATDLPADLASAAAVGTSTKAAKADHKHKFQSAINTNFSAGESSQSILSAVERSYDFLGVNRLAFLKPEQISIEHSTDGGETWTDSGYTAEEKANLFIKGGIGVVKIGPKNQTSALVGYQTRVTLTSTGADVAYGSYDWINVFASGGDAAGGQIRCDLSFAPGNNENTFTTFSADAKIEWQPYWMGANSIHFAPRVFFPPNTSPNLAKKFRITFKITAESSTGSFKPTIRGIQGFANTPLPLETSYMATTGHLYDYDYLQNAIFPANVTAQNFIGNGSRLTNLPIPEIDYTSLPVANGTPFAGISDKVAAADHVHPLSTFQQLGINDTSIRGVLTGGNVGDVLTRGSTSAEWKNIDDKIAKRFYFSSAAKKLNIESSLAFTPGSRKFGVFEVLIFGVTDNSATKILVDFDVSAVSGTDRVAYANLHVLGGAVPISGYLYISSETRVNMWLELNQGARVVYASAKTSSGTEELNILSVTSVLTKPTATIGSDVVISNYATSSEITTLLAGKQDAITSSAGQIIVNDAGTIKGANTIASSKVSGLGTLAAKNNISPSDFADPGSAGKVLASQTASNGDFEAAWKTLAVADISGLQTALDGKQGSIASTDGQIIVNDNGTIKGVNDIPYTSVDGLGALATLDMVTYNKITPAGTAGQVLITRPSGSSRATAWDTLNANDIQALSGSTTPTAGSIAEQLANLADADHNHNAVITITNSAGAVQTAAETQFQSVFGTSGGGYTATKSVMLLLPGIATTTSITLPSVADIGSTVTMVYTGEGDPTSVSYKVKCSAGNTIHVAADNEKITSASSVSCFSGEKAVFRRISSTEWLCTHEVISTTQEAEGGGTTGGGGTASVSRTIIKLEAAPTAASKNFDVTYGTGDTYVYIYIRGTHNDDYNLILPSNPTDGQIVKVAYLNHVNNNSSQYDPLAIIVKPATDSQHIYAPQFTTSTDGKVASFTLHKEGYWESGSSLPCYNTVELIYNSADSSWYTMPFGATLTY